MKYITTLILFITISLGALAQDDGPKTVTPQVLQKIKDSVENEVPSFKRKLGRKEYTAAEIEFATDTFRLEKVTNRRMEIDFSTIGMNKAVYEMTAGYDKLMNKYYNKLLAVLKPDDKKVLVTAQRAWLAYRDAENNLSAIMTKEEYSGGGTIQSNFISGRYSHMVISRTLQIFDYYNDVVNDK